ncbi:type II-A CRISPR-associated protein Csn2 [Suipraeoptans intestinalis]|uniref:type II-A CRISPR-associated protein Csn2 n=1 Tax=Suipraeoptans intestinalis TaxID=2606628 RepID=UPI002A7497B9|nr:type II-A CRISPR-associated protein Csn2 [Suipraeoptans intestinalis]MDY3122500.1 type II-A CRISPR-associated protein Csn2 [Suipraeoptans intestinalis]
MRIILPEIDRVFECAGDKSCSIVIENQKVLYMIVSDIFQQIQGNEGAAVLSEENKVLSFAKYGELHSQFVPFDMNSKNLVAKIIAKMQRLAIEETHYIKTKEILGEWESHLMDLSMEMTGSFVFTKMSPETLIKSAGVCIDDLQESLGEKLLDYFELVQEYDAKKLFILVNLRSFVSDEEMEKFLESVLARKIQLLLLESSEHKMLKTERRYIVDEDLCVLC